MMPVYLLHFSDPLGDSRVWPLHHARHYLGSCADMDSRLTDHRALRGGRLPAVAVERGLELIVARTWPTDDSRRDLERKLKRRHNGPSLCPLCRKEASCHG